MSTTTPPAPDARYTRIFTEQPKKLRDWREPAERDCDRILYCSAFRRLEGVTQVVGAHEGSVFHNRLTHSHRVSQVARRLAQKLVRQYPAKVLSEIGGVDPDVAEAAGLGHDLGHPPFGHIAEQVLNDLVSDVYGDPDGFEGNAQSFRVVTKLARRAPHPNPPGLNLTRATLNAILKYPWFRENRDPATGRFPDTKKARKWGTYRSEEREFTEARKLHPTAGTELKSVEAEIMDWADDVTYAVHDAEDFYRAGLIPLDRLSLRDDSERQRFFDGIESSQDLLTSIGGRLTGDYKEAFYKVVIGFPLDEDYKGTGDQRSSLRFFFSALIGEYIDAFRIGVSGAPWVEIDPQRERQVKMLKLLTWHYVIYNPSLATQQYGQRKMIRELFEIFHKAGSEPSKRNLEIFPFAVRDEVESAAGDRCRVARVVTDLIGSMTERQVVEIYQRMSGVALGSILHKPFS